MSEPFKVGDFVACLGAYDRRPYSIRKVVRVLARFVELSDGSKWDLHGHPYPRQRGYGVPSIVHATAAHRDAIRGENLRGKIRDAATRRDGLDGLPLDTLDKIAALMGVGR
jgi:hypothetical protein